jgi:phage tail sheath protein FI
MAEQIISPGVFTNENDQSQVTSQPPVVGAAIIGPTAKGPVEIPTLVTSYSQFKQIFGGAVTSGSDTYNFFTGITAYNYFNNGGTSLLVARVVSGSGAQAYTSATSTPISASTQAASQPAFVLETLSKGIIMNSSSSEGSAGQLASGSSDNIRWQISQRDTASGTFTLVIRQGNDTTNTPSVLETWSGLSLDPKASNFIGSVIGDYNYYYNSSNNQVEVSGSYPNKSAYVRVKSVNLTTPDYFDNNGVAKSQYTSSLPLVASGSFTSATGDIKAGALFYNSIGSGNTQGLVSDNYTNMINLLSNKDDYKYNVLVTPGLYKADYGTPISNIIINTQNRGDAIYVADMVAYGSTVATAVTNAATIDNSYATTYWPWLQISDPETGKNVWVPASTMMPGVYAFNDSVAAEWFAPAGFNRGGLGNVLRVEQKLSQSSRDSLYLGKVNPIATFPGQGIVVFGQKTLQTKASALDRVNVRRLLIALKNYIGGVSNNLVFEQNSIATRNSFLSQVNPYLASVQQRQGLYAYKVVMDESNNTADVIDRNQLVGAIYIQPTKTAEFVVLNFNILPTGASFE